MLFSCMDEKTYLVLLVLMDIMICLVVFVCIQQCCVDIFYNNNTFLYECFPLKSGSFRIFEFFFLLIQCLSVVC